VRALARWVSILLTLVAAAVVALVVLPAPTKAASYLAIFFDEKTPFIVGAVVLAAGLARLSNARAWIVAQTMFGLAIVAVACVAPGQALRVGVKNHVAIDFARYLQAPVDEGGGHPSQTVVYNTVAGQALALDVYRPTPPANAAAPAPAIIVLHEGGWSAGDKGSAPRMSAWLASHGWAVFDVQYRLAPQPTWQAAIGDVKCAIGWVKRHARDVGVEVDPARVTLLGRSAGAHLAMLAAYAPDEPALPPSCAAGDTHVASVISFYGPTDLVWAWNHPTNPRVFDTPGRLGSYIGGTPATQPERFRLLSPLTHVTSGAPPTLLLHGGHDAFVPLAHTELMDAKLSAAGVRHEVLVVPYGQHGFDFIFGGLGEQLAEQTILRFLRAGR
jgi:acetyl esterase/lipase